MRLLGERIVGCGVDIIEIHRVARAMRRKRFAERLYTKREQEALHGRPPASWAARFAGKEAAMKALGTGWQKGIGFAQIEILQNGEGTPYITLHGAAHETARRQGITSLLVSLSHTAELAVAYVVAVGHCVSS